MKSRILQILTLAAVVVLAQGCGAFRSPPEEVRLYTLTYPPVQTSETGSQSRAVLKIEPLRAADPYGSDTIVYAKNKYSRGTYVYHKWAAKPAEMIGDLIIRDIRASQIAEAVVTSASRASFTHSLHVNIDAFYEDDSADPWQAVVQITVLLEENRPQNQNARVLMHKTYRSEKAMEQNNPLGLARAMSAALQEISTSMIKDISGRL
ncbi:MAG: ABC-type transport auxiliary lipoprotein family protein [Desulfobacteraceae bacterium]|nr:ABC-type transport auxiliary lipoprotein family protein [Desulfobacteraceae bacterium]